MTRSEICRCIANLAVATRWNNTSGRIGVTTQGGVVFQEHGHPFDDIVVEFFDTGKPGFEFRDSGKQVYRLFRDTLLDQVSKSNPDYNIVWAETGTNGG